MSLLYHLQGKYFIAKLADDSIVLRNPSGKEADAKCVCTKARRLYEKVQILRKHPKKNQAKLEQCLSQPLEQFDSVSTLNQSSGSAAEQPALVRSPRGLNLYPFFMGKGLIQMIRWEGFNQTLKGERFHSNAYGKGLIQMVRGKGLSQMFRRFHSNVQGGRSRLNI